jgi:hypothetical protein
VGGTGEGVGGGVGGGVGEAGVGAPQLPAPGVLGWQRPPAHSHVPQQTAAPEHGSQAFLQLPPSQVDTATSSSTSMVWRAMLDAGCGVQGVKSIGVQYHWYYKA